MINLTLYVVLKSGSCFINTLYILMNCNYNFTCYFYLEQLNTYPLYFLLCKRAYYTTTVLVQYTKVLVCYNYQLTLVCLIVDTVKDLKSSISKVRSEKDFRRHSNISDGVLMFMLLRHQLKIARLQTIYLIVIPYNLYVTFFGVLTIINVFAPFSHSGTLLPD